MASVLRPKAKRYRSDRTGGHTAKGNIGANGSIDAQDYQCGRRPTTYVRTIANRTAYNGQPLTTEQAALLDGVMFDKTPRDRKNYGGYVGWATKLVEWYCLSQEFGVAIPKWVAADIRKYPEDCARLLRVPVEQLLASLD